MRKGRKGRRHHRRSHALARRSHHARAMTPAASYENPLGGLGELVVGTGAGALAGLALYQYAQSTTNTGSTNPITIPTAGVGAMIGAVLGLVVAGAAVAVGKL